MTITNDHNQCSWHCFLAVKEEVQTWKCFLCENCMPGLSKFLFFFSLSLFGFSGPLIGLFGWTFLDSLYQSSLSLRERLMEKERWDRRGCWESRSISGTKMGSGWIRWMSSFCSGQAVWPHRFAPTLPCPAPVAPSKVKDGLGSGHWFGVCSGSEGNIRNCLNLGCDRACLPFLATKIVASVKLSVELIVSFVSCVHQAESAAESGARAPLLATEPDTGDVVGLVAPSHMVSGHRNRPRAVPSCAPELKQELNSLGGDMENLFKIYHKISIYIYRWKTSFFGELSIRCSGCLVFGGVFAVIYGDVVGVAWRPGGFGAIHVSTGWDYLLWHFNCIISNIGRWENSVFCLSCGFATQWGRAGKAQKSEGRAANQRRRHRCWTWLCSNYQQGLISVWSCGWCMMAHV